MKKKAVTYSVVARVDPRDLSAGVSYYARAHARGSVTLADMAERIQKRCTLNKVDVLAVLAALEGEIRAGLRNGEIIRLGDIGSLQLGVGSEGVPSAGEFVASMINKVWVNFRPGDALKGISEGLSFERVPCGDSVCPKKRKR